VDLGPVILFSAAIPHQQGVEHINEQWPSYWFERFRSHGYRVIDCIRSLIWLDDSLPAHYRQNLLLYASEDYLSANPTLRALAERTDERRLSIVHPVYFETRSRQLEAWEASPIGKVRRISNRVRSMLKR